MTPHETFHLKCNLIQAIGEDNLSQIIKGSGSKQQKLELMNNVNEWVLARMEEAQDELRKTLVTELANQNQN